MTMQRPTLHEVHAVLLEGEEIEVMESFFYAEPLSEMLSSDLGNISV